MSSETTVTRMKVCCQCSEPLAGKKRMKDHEGRYWCMDCGERDRQKRLQTIKAPGDLCAACHQKFPENKLQKWGHMLYCPKCYKRVSRADHHGIMDAVKTAADNEFNRRWIYLGIGVVVLIVLILLPKLLG